MARSLSDFREPANIALLKQLVFENSAVHPLFSRASKLFFSYLDQFVHSVRTGAIPYFSTHPETITLLNLNRFFARYFIERLHLESSTVGQETREAQHDFPQKRAWDGAEVSALNIPPADTSSHPADTNVRSAINVNQFVDLDPHSQQKHPQLSSAHAPPSQTQRDIKNILKRATQAPVSPASSSCRNDMIYETRIESMEQMVIALKQECERLRAKVDLLSIVADKN